MAVLPWTFSASAMATYTLCIAILLSLLNASLAEGATVLPPKELRLAVITPRDRDRLFSLEKVLPAVEYALNSTTVRQRFPRTRFQVILADSKCNTVNAPISAFSLYWVSGVKVFLGPVCDYSLAPVARYSPYWGKSGCPVITPGGMAHDFGANKSAANAEFPLLTRVGGTFDSLSRALLAIFSHFRYANATVKVVYNRDGHQEVAPRFCYLAMSALVNVFRIRKWDYHLYLYLTGKRKDKERKMLTEEIGTKYGSKLNLIF